MKNFDTERLSISEFTTADAAFILELLNTSSWLQFVGDRGVKNIDDAVKYINDKYIESYKKNGFGLYKIALKNETPIGMCGLIKRDTLDNIDIGFALLPVYEGKGYGYEAASIILKHAKNVLRIKRIVAITTKTNINSITLLKKLDLKFEKLIRMEGDEEELMLFGTSDAMDH